MSRRSFRCPPSSNVNIALAVTSSHKRRMTQQIDPRTPHYSQNKKTLAGNDVVSNKRFDYCLELHVRGLGRMNHSPRLICLKRNGTLGLRRVLSATCTLISVKGSLLWFLISFCCYDGWAVLEISCRNGGLLL